jgi:hypothetical protein
LVVFPRIGTDQPIVRIQSRSGGFLKENEMALNDVLTLEALLLALIVRQARNELESTIAQAEQRLREMAL